MALFRYIPHKIGGFVLMYAEPLAGDSMHIQCAEDIPAKKSGTCFVVTRGRVEYTDYPEGFNSVPIVPGVSSEAFGKRVKGDYIMTAMEDSTFICISPIGNKKAKFQRDDVSISAGDRYTIKKGELAVFTMGEFERGGSLKRAPCVLFAEFNDTLITAVADTHALVLKR